jgi:hypothetical protein
MAATTPLAIHPHRTHEHTQTGVANLRCLKGLVERQQTPCHFGFYQLDFEADCPVLVLSRSRSILGGGALCQLPYSPPTTTTTTTTTAGDASSAAVEVPELDAETLRAFRRYLAWAAQQEVEIDASVGERAEREFVGLRGTEEGKKTLTPEVLGRWLTMCRLLCAAEGGGGKVVGGHWERMRALEEERMGRLKALGLEPPAQ